MKLFTGVTPMQARYPALTLFAEVVPREQLSGI